MENLESQNMEQNDNGNQIEFRHLDIKALAREMETTTFRDIDSLKAFEILVLKLKEKLLEYDTILSDDASGRLVSLVLRKVIDKVKFENREAPVKTYFLSSGRSILSETEESVERFLDSKKADIEKALLVTEYIATGESIKKLVTILDELGIQFDIATLSIDEPQETYSYKISSRLNYGDVNRVGLNFYKKKFHSGVEKSYSDSSPHPSKFKYIDAYGDPNSEGVVAARRDVDRLAKALISIM